MGTLTRDGPTASRETKFAGANGDDRESIIFPVQLTTSRIGNLNRPIHALLYTSDVIHTIWETFVLQQRYL